jgi:hypothetical protein
MQLWQARLIDEKKHLNEKIDRLQDFIQSMAFDRLPHDERMLLIRQSEVMVEYSEVLGTRIGKFT